MNNTGNTELNFCYNCMTQMDSGQYLCPVCGHDNRLRQNTENALPEGTILAGKYLVGRMLGQGGFGITYLGFDIALGVKVAVKEYFPSGICIRSPHSIRISALSSQEKAEGFRKGCDEFQEEARRLAQIESPYIVKVRDYFREKGTAYIIMNYIDGNSLTKEAAVLGGSIPWPRVVELFKPLILEMDNLHRAHLIHRDIKPDNIKIKTGNNGTEHLVLLDFGAARNFVSAEVTGTYSAMVTQGYAPIEQYSRQSRQGPYTDIYALCATMYALITGRIPAAATDRMTGEASVKTFPEMGLEVPKRIEKAIFHGLAIRSTDRPGSMRELYDEISGGTPEEAFKTERVDAPVFQAYAAPKKSGKFKLWLLIPLLAVLAAAGVLVYRNTHRTQEPALPSQTAVSAERNTPAGAGTTATAANTPVPSNTAVPTNTPAPTDTTVPTSTPDNQITPESTMTPRSAETGPALSALSGISVGDVITFGRYEQDNDPENGPEAVEWQVLAVENGRALVISKYALDAKAYHEVNTGVTWETSSLRAWLNGEFYDSTFSPVEKERILTVTVSNPDNRKYDVKGGNDTEDRLFLLSISEAELYFPDSMSRKASVSEFARAHNANTGPAGSGTWWWLRSPGFSDAHAAYVYTMGLVYDNGYYVSTAEGSVRPACWISL